MEVSGNSGCSSGSYCRTGLGGAFCKRRVDERYSAIPAPALRDRYISVSQKYVSSSNVKDYQGFDSDDDDEDDSYSDEEDPEGGYELNYEPNTRRKVFQSAYTLEEDISYALSQRRKARQTLREAPRPGPSRLGEVELNERFNHDEQQGRSRLERTSVASSAPVTPMVAQTSSNRTYGHRLGHERLIGRPTADGVQHNQTEKRVEKGKDRTQGASSVETPVDELAKLEKVVAGKERDKKQTAPSTRKLLKNLAKLKEVVAGKQKA
jgi:hypothetical protein